MRLREFKFNNNKYTWFAIREDNEWFYWTSEYTLDDGFNIELQISKFEEGFRLYCIDSSKYSYLYIDANNYAEFNTAGLFESNGYKYNSINYIERSLVIADYYTRYLLDIQDI